MSVDLHTHTTHSDGTFGPAELVDQACKKNLTAIAITDHDITSGNDEAISRGKASGIKVIPGIELSVDADLPGKGHLHILGVFPFLKKNIDSGETLAGVLRAGKIVDVSPMR